jgi:hypothetical protein
MTGSAAFWVIKVGRTRNHEGPTGLSEGQQYALLAVVALIAVVVGVLVYTSSVERSRGSVRRRRLGQRE